MSTIILPSIEDGLSQYLRHIYKFPILSFEEEQRLAYDFKNNGTLESAHTLVTSHLALVVKIVKKFRGYNMPIIDLISEGNIGLMVAVKKFDPDKGFRLSTYAMMWIRVHIQDYVMKNWSLVKIGTTRAQKRLFFNLRKLKSKLDILDASLTDNHCEKIATKLNVTIKEVKEMEGRLGINDFSLSVTDENQSSWEERLVDDSPTPDVFYEQNDFINYKSKLLLDGVNSLDDRQKDIFISRHLLEEPLTFEQLGVKYNISKQRVEQIEKVAFEKVKKYVINRK
jgi:RNA polymerase sigma-32 factor